MYGAWRSCAKFSIYWAVAAWGLSASRLLAQFSGPPPIPQELGAAPIAEGVNAPAMDPGYSLGPYAPFGVQLSGFSLPYTSNPTTNGTMVGYPFELGDANVNPRVTAYYDTTRMNPNAVGLFLPSAIPVKGDAYYGSGGQSGYTSNGTGTGLGFSSPEFGLNGLVELNVQSTATDGVAVTLPVAIVKWNWLTIGVTDSTFTDINALPDLDDQGGPIGRPMIRSTMGTAGQPQMRFALREPQDGAYSGFYANIGVEQPGADVLDPVDVVVPGLTPVMHYSSFARYPDLIATLRYQDGGFVNNSWTGKQAPYENWHIQFGALARDIGVEGDGKGAPDVRETTTGWGTQLSGRCTLFGDENPATGCHDYIMFSITYGEGIGHYFPDLHVISPTNDAAYNSVTNTLDPLPVLAYFGAYEHDWTRNLESSVTYSHINLDSQLVPGNPTVPYKLGDYFAVNLVWHNTYEIGQPTSAASSHTELTLFGGGEYLFGERENLAGATGTDQRIEIFFAAAK